MVSHPGRRSNTPSFEIFIRLDGEDWKPEALRLLHSVSVALYGLDNDGTLYNRAGQRIGHWRYRPKPDAAARDGGRP